jgi:hypothetical protein
MRFQLKGFTSLLLTLLFVALSFSGVILYLTPRGRVANWTGWTMLGLEKQGWQAVHVNIGLLFLIAAGLHLFLNWGLFWGYIKKKASLGLNLKLEMLVAVLIAAGVLLGTIQGVSPFAALMALNEQIKDYWEREPVSAPLPHAEELSLEQLAGRMGLSTEQVFSALKQEGIAVENGATTIAKLAEKSRLTPSEVYAAIKKHFPESQQSEPAQSAGGPGRGEGKGGGFGPGRGQGRGMGKKMQE